MIHLPSWFVNAPRVATVVEDRGTQVLIEFEDGEQKVVNKTDLNLPEE